MIGALFFCMVMVILVAVVYVYLRREQRKIFPQTMVEEHSTVSAVLNRPSFPFRVGLVIASIHFLVTYLLGVTSDLDQVKFTLIAPGFLLSLVLGYFKLPASFAQFLFIVVSSSAYGSIGALLVSGRPYMQFIGVLLTGLLVWLGMFLWVGAMISSA
jgi:hypothetical protein